MAGSRALEGLTLVSFLLLILLIALGYATAGTVTFVLVASALLLDLAAFAFGLYATQSR